MQATGRKDMASDQAKAQATKATDTFHVLKFMACKQLPTFNDKQPDTLAGNPYLL